MEAAGITLAQARRPAMLALIQSDPKLAFDLTVPAALRQMLPAAIQDELETPVSGTGDYALIPVEPSAGRGSHTSDIERFVFLSGERYSAHVYGRRATQLTQENASLHGIALDGHMALHESPLRVLEPDEIATRSVEPRDPISGHATTTGTNGALVVEAQSRIWVLSAAENVLLLADELEAAEDLPGPNVPALGAASDAGEVAAVSAASPASWTMGTKKILIVRVDFSDVPGEPVYSAAGQPFTLANWRNLMDDEVAPFYPRFRS